MKSVLKKYKTLFVLLAFALSAILFSACGSTSDLGLQGAAGQETDTPSIQETQEVQASPEPPTNTPIPPAPGHILFISSRDGQPDIYLSLPDGSEATRLTTIGTLDSSSTLRVSPNGTKVAFVSTVDNNKDVYTLDLTTNSITRITDAIEKDSAPSWSPDGQYLVFESFRDGNFEIYATAADGSNPIRLTGDPSGDNNPVWSPVSNDIVFVTNRFGNSDLVLLNLNGAISTLTTNPAPDNNPVWSPDGNFIAFQTFTDDRSNICVIGRDGLNQRCLTGNTDEYSSPAWSPDGKWLAATTTTDIHIFNVADGTETLLTPSDISPRGTPSWSPDGLRLVFQAQFEGDMELFSVFLPTGEFTRLTATPGYDGEPVWLSQ